MHASFHKQIILFCAAVVIPSLLLTAVGIRLLLQEDELQDARLLERRRVAARELNLQLVEGLQSPARGAVVATLAWQQNKIFLPWEIDLERSRSELSAVTDEFRRELSRGELLEFTDADYSAAAEAYSHALRLAARETPKALARLNLARSFISGGHVEAAAAHVGELLQTPLAITDEYGLPFAVFAIAQAERLPASLAPDVGVSLNGLFEDFPWLAPATLRTIAAHRIERPPGEGQGETVEGRGETPADLVESLLARSGRLESLRDEFGSLLATAGLTRTNTPEPRLWLAARGEPLWLVGFTPGGEESTVTVVRAEHLLAETSAATEDLGLTTVGSAVSVPLGARFPGIFVRFPEAFDADLAAASRLRRLLYAGVLFVVVSVTAFGAWFVTRDIRREARLIEMRSRFVASVSHELKTPLTAVRMFAETLQRDRLAPEKRKRYVDTILAESERLSRLLDNVLDFSKIERGEKHYALETVRLQEPLRRAINALKHQLARQGYSLETAIDDAVPAVVADADAIEQAVVNLVSNAVKYSNGRQKIDLSLQLEGDEAVISVRDRGIGINEADRGKIFDEFFRAAAADRSQVPGTGLGLTIVAHIAEAHGARIDVDSEPGKGSTFSLRLPIAGGDEHSGGTAS